VEIAASENIPKRDVVAHPWMLPVTWEGAPPAPKPTQTAVARLYAGKKRMFKGHKWQRVRAQLNAHRRNLMRDMEKRVKRYKNYYARRRPNPLMPATTAKQPKLPF
jgi:large subunit ribosomal protein L25